MKSKVVVKIDGNCLLISFVHIYVYTHICICAHICICMSVYVYVCFFTYTYLENKIMPSFLHFGYVFNPEFLNALGFVCLFVCLCLCLAFFNMDKIIPKKEL